MLHYHSATMFPVNYRTNIENESNTTLMCDPFRFATCVTRDLRLVDVPTIVLQCLTLLVGSFDP